jgi:hypothetical protein
VKKLRRREAEGARSRGQGRGGERGEEREQPVTREEEAGGGELGRHGDACHGVFGLRGGGRVCGSIPCPVPSVLLRAWWTCCVILYRERRGPGARWVWDSGSASPNSVA